MIKNGFFRLFVAVSLSVFLFAACEKDDPTNNPNPGSDTYVPDDYAQYLMGPWSVVLDQSYEQYTEGDDYQEMTYCSDWASEITLTFKENGKLGYSAVVYGVEDSWDDNYSVSSDTLMWDVKPYVISVSDENHCQIESKVVTERTTRGGQTYTTSATKHYDLIRQ